MVAYYRLNELDYRLAEGMQVLAPEVFAPVEEAVGLVEQARMHAAAIVQDAEKVREDERRKGFEQGLLEGRLQAVEQFLHQSADIDSRLGALEQELAGIVSGCVRQIIDGFDATSQAEAMVRGALKQMRREKKAELRVSPEQHAHFRKAVDGILADFPGYELIEVVEDTTLSAPQVVVETSIGRVEGDLGTRLADLDDIIREHARIAVHADDGTDGSVAVAPQEREEE